LHIGYRGWRQLCRYLWSQALPVSVGEQNDGSGASCADHAVAADHRTFYPVALPDACETRLGKGGCRGLADGKSVVAGDVVSVRINLGGHGFMKKKTKKT